MYRSLLLFAVAFLPLCSFAQTEHVAGIQSSWRAPVGVEYWQLREESRIGLRLGARTHLSSPRKPPGMIEVLFVPNQQPSPEREERLGVRAHFLTAGGTNRVYENVYGYFESGVALVEVYKRGIRDRPLRLRSTFGFGTLYRWKRLVISAGYSVFHHEGLRHDVNIGVGVQLNTH